jgi:hypothetical protein
LWLWVCFGGPNMFCLCRPNKQSLRRHKSGLPTHQNP